MPTTRTAAILSTLLLALSTVTAAQTTPATSTLQVYSNEVVLDVTITDAHGNAVHNLKQQDFTIKEDGKPQSIRSFHESTSQTIPPPRQLPPHTYTNVQPRPASSAVNFILLDGLNTAPTDPTDPESVTLSFSIQKAVKQEAKEFLHSMPPGTRVAILDLSRNLRVLQGVTSDPELLRAAVDTMDLNLDGRASTPEQWCVQQQTRNHATLEAIGQIASDSAAIKGRKNLIWFTAGMPAATDPAVNVQVRCNVGFNLQGAGVSGPAFQLLEPLPDLTPALQKTYALLAAAQMTIFPISPFALGKAFSPIGTSLIGPGDDMWANINLSLESIAESTGGVAYYNTNDLAGAVSKAVEKGANFYTISYVPPSKKYDYGHHNLKVQLNLDPPQPKLHLVYRETYDNVDPATIKPPPALTLAALPETASADPEALMRTAMGRSIPTSTDLLFDVQVEPSTEPAKPTDPAVFGNLDPKLAALSATNAKLLTRYSFEYAFPARQLTFTPTPEGNQKTVLEFDIAAYDGDGKLVTSLSQSIKPVLTPAQHDQLLKGPFRFFQQLDLPPGPLFLRIGILDPTANKIGTVEIPLTVPKK